ncbi:MAG: histidine kinase [Bacteroidota bacterium]|nr:histidine kinase [Bacteroidota bacterium]
MPAFDPINKRQLYWQCQLGGWLLFVLLDGFYIFLRDQFTTSFAFSLIFIFLFGILLTQLLRWVIIRFNLLKLSVPKVVPVILTCNFLMALFMTFLQTGFDRVATGEEMSKGNWLISVSNFTLFFLFWSAIYFVVHFVENYKKAEIQKFKWIAAIHEAELNKLKSQLNPHFMFNAMNSIRALVVENPGKAKEAITQFSNLLRNTLQMGKQKLIPFAQELEAVKDYLAIEAVRLEERLQLEWKIGPGTESMEVPPLMIQTLVENGIKHGVARLPEGGKLSVESKKNDDGLEITIRNSGQYDATKIPESGFGMRNTIQRLSLLYAGKAKLEIANEDAKTVITKLFIPATTAEPK